MDNTDTIPTPDDLISLTTAVLTAELIVGKLSDFKEEKKRDPSGWLKLRITLRSQVRLSRASLQALHMLRNRNENTFDALSEDQRAEVSRILRNSEAFTAFIDAIEAFLDRVEPVPTSC